jgi:glycosyltransferase involved in cell wall biosynthesis
MALLEAMSYGLPVLVSDIAANREIGLEAEQYLALGDVEMLAVHMQRVAATLVTKAKREATRSWVAACYSWPAVASAILAVCRSGITD